MYSCKSNRIYNILFLSLFLRCMILAIVLLASPYLSDGFLGSSIDQDDYRYELGAELYRDSATKVIDKKAFADAYRSLGDYTGDVGGIISATSLWYWICCILTYVTRTTVSIRLLNILFSIGAVYILYKILVLYYDEKIALLGASLLAFCPYPSFFACFAYKDIMFMFLSLLLLYFSCLYRFKIHISGIIIFSIPLLCFCLMSTRGGMSAIWIILCIGNACCTKSFFVDKKNRVLHYAIIVIAFAICCFVILSSFDTILYKLSYYILDRSEESGIIQYFSINSFTDIYKLPFALIFAFLQPLFLGNSITTWIDVVGIINYLFIFVVVGAVFDLFLIHKREDKVLIFLLLAYYCMSITASLGIVRHYSGLIFIPIILFSHFYHSSSCEDKKLWIICSLVLFLLLTFYIMIK